MLAVAGQPSWSFPPGEEVLAAPVHLVADTQGRTSLHCYDCCLFKPINLAHD